MRSWDHPHPSERGMGHAAGVGSSGSESSVICCPLPMAVQARGWISPAALSYICERLTIPPAEAMAWPAFMPSWHHHSHPSLCTFAKISPVWSMGPTKSVLSWSVASAQGYADGRWACDLAS